MDQPIQLASAWRNLPEGTIVHLDHDTGEVRDEHGTVVRRLAVLPEDVHVPELVPTFLAEWKVPGMRAEDVAPVLPVDHRHDKLQIENFEDAYVEINPEQSLQAPVQQVDPTIDQTEYKTVDMALASFIPDVTEREEGSLTRFRVRQAAAKKCARAISIWRERKLWTLLTTAANWNANNVATLGSGEEWNDPDSDPISDLLSRLSASPMRITDIWMNRNVANVFLQHTKVIAHLRTFNGDNAIARDIMNVTANTRTEQTVDFSIPGLPPIHVVELQSQPTRGGTFRTALGDHVVLTMSNPGEDLATVRTLRVKNPAPQGSAGTGYASREFRDEQRGPEGGKVLVVHTSEVPFMISNRVGGLIRNVIQ
jgi:hypothetical protein